MMELSELMGSSCAEVYNNLPMLEVAMLKTLNETPVNKAASLASDMLSLLNSITKQTSRAGFKNQAHTTKTRKVLKFIASNPEEYYRGLQNVISGVV